jgi:fibronectin type 3 domain-containing protein
MKLLILALLVAASGWAQTHSVKLSWTQSTTTGVTTNNVYRSTTSGGPYAVVANLPAATTYTDQTVVGGTTYFYVVTALVGTLESGKSTQVTTTVPNTPNAPTNLTATAQ